MSLKTLSLSEINQLDNARFIHELGAIFEHSPWVAHGVADQRPFPTIAALHAAMVACVATANHDQQLALIRAHPELAGKAAIRGELTQDSTKEQSGAGLNACSPEEYETLARLNTAYNEKFRFPFILEVTGHNRASIIENFTTRLGNTQAVEFEVCLQQIYRIAEIRLRALIRDSLL